MSLKLNSSGGGSVTLQEPTTASTRTLNLPDNSGTVVSTGSTAVVSQAMLATGVAGTGPAFSAYNGGSAQNVTSGTWTKITLSTEDFDTANCFDSTTNYRFTPNVAGYYAAFGSFDVTGSSTSGVIMAVYKNGSVYNWGNYIANAVGEVIANVTSLVYLNGTTDYIEFYGRASGSSLQFQNNAALKCGAYLVRAA